MKICKKCYQSKPLDSFYRDAALCDGHSNSCKECKNASTAIWREVNREKYNKDAKAWRDKNVDKRRNNDLQTKYGISLDEYNRRLAKQGGVCAICKKPNTSTKRIFAMDHDHKTGKARGVLCYGCNRGLHMIESGLLEAAMAYLKKHQG